MSSLESKRLLSRKIIRLFLVIILLKIAYSVFQRFPTSAEWHDLGSVSTQGKFEFTAFNLLGIILGLLPYATIATIAVMCSKAFTPAIFLGVGVIASDQYSTYYFSHDVDGQAGCSTAFMYLVLLIAVVLMFVFINLFFRKSQSGMCRG